MAQAVGRRLLTAAARVRAQVNVVGLVVDKVGDTGTGFSPSPSVFPPSISFHRDLHISEN
jgi:hypothetical protein